MRSTIIKNATCVMPQGALHKGHVLIEDGRIAAVDASPGTRAGEVVDGSGLFLIPGLIDDQVHFREPGLTHKEDLHTGSMACAKGGITTFLEMPNTSPAATSMDRIREKLRLAASKSVVNYGFYIGATEQNVDELARADRVAGIKIFIGSSTGDLLVDSQEALERIFADTMLPLTAHCEDEATIRANRARLTEGSGADNLPVSIHSEVRDTRAAVIATERAVDLARRHNHRFHVLHVSTAAETRLLKDHAGLITGEVCPHHLFFTIDDYARLGTRIQANPSVKTRDDQDALWDALRGGTLQVVATDHAPHTLEEKSRPYPESPSGVPCVENSLALMLSAVNEGRCTLPQVVRWMCEAPALVWDIVNKGRIEPGFDADLVLIDMEAQMTIRDEEQVTKSGWSPWHGATLTGRPVRTWVMGQTVYAQGTIDEHARGREIIYDHARGGYWGSQTN